MQILDSRKSYKEIYRKLIIGNFLPYWVVRKLQTKFHLEIESNKFD